MENYILYYYGINIKNINYQKTYYIFYDEENMYYFCKTNKSEQELILLNKEKDSNYHELILNKENKYISIYQDESYCLEKINCILNDSIDLETIINNNIKTTRKNIIWGTIWQNKVDYLENQMNNLGIKKRLLINSFNYYIGLAENAISYFNQEEISSNNIYLVHHRIYYPNLPINYYNTLNLIPDYKVRDYAEYIRTLFYSDNSKTIMKSVKRIINDPNLTYQDIKLFYNRLLFPSNYFDYFEKLILEDNLELEKELEHIISKSQEYELFLKDVYYEIKVKYDIPPIDWIIKRSNTL